MQALLLSLALTSACATAPFSGLPVSADVPPFRPQHLNGPLAGTDACPVCTNGNAPQVQIWARREDAEQAFALARALGSSLPEETKASLPAYLVLVGGDAESLSPQAGPRVATLHAADLAAVDAEVYNIPEDARIRTTVHWVTNRRVLARDVNLSPEDAGRRVTSLWPRLEHFSRDYEETCFEIAPRWEPGERLVITGRVVDAQGAPLEGHKLRAWQTNADGLYNEPEHRRQEPILEGIQWTGPEGSYRWETIRPAPYPTGTEPAHIHMELDRDRPTPYWRTLWFEGDPLLSDEKRAWADEDEETVIIELELKEGTWVGEHDIVVTDG